MVSENDSCSSSNRSPGVGNPYTTRIFSDVAGDITVIVDEEPYLLHKFPLVSKSGKIRKMIGDAKSSNISKLELINFPGGRLAFELAVKFCNGMNFHITAANVAPLRCAAEYLEMTEDYKEENLIARTEVYLNEIVVLSFDKSLEVLCICESLPPIAKEVGIVGRCVEGLAKNACKEQLASRLSRLDCDGESTEHKSGNGNRNGDWWIKDLSVLRIDYYEKVICAMGRVGVRPDSIIESLMHYAQTSLKGVGKCQNWNLSRMRSNSGIEEETDQKLIVETIVNLFPTEKSSSIPLSFLFGMLRMAVLHEASTASRLELERRIALRLEIVSIDDLLIPSLGPEDSLFDVDTVNRILVNFLQQHIGDAKNEDYAYESDDLGSPSHASLQKVGRLIDTYLAEIAPDSYLSLQKFIAFIELLPDYARVTNDGLYRAVDIYLKAHPMLTDHECKKLCKLIDCKKLSQEACNHAAQNERLPIQMAVRIMYTEQLRLKNALSADSSDGLLSQKLSSGVPSAATISPQDNYASLRRENRELKLEISRMRVRVSELEKEQMFMKRGMMDNKSGSSKTFLNSLSKGIGRIGIFSGPVGTKQKSNRKSRGSDGKTGRNRRKGVKNILDAGLERADAVKKKFCHDYLPKREDNKEINELEHHIS